MQHDCSLGNSAGSNSTLLNKFMNYFNKNFQGCYHYIIDTRFFKHDVRERVSVFQNILTFLRTRGFMDVEMSLCCYHYSKDTKFLGHGFHETAAVFKSFRRFLGFGGLEVSAMLKCFCGQ